MNEALVIEYVELNEQTIVEALFSSKAVEQRYYDRLDQLWYAEMTQDDRDEAQKRLSTPITLSCKDDRYEECPCASLIVSAT